jgi:hypothetical protein
MTRSIFLAILLIAGQAHANRLVLPQEQLDEETKLTLARAMVGEADWHEPDHVAIAFVLARRWPLYREHGQPVPFQTYIQRYSSALRRDSGARSAWLRSLPWGPIQGPFAGHWDRVRALVERWSQGKIKDPCPGAMHWGGAMDRPAASLKPVSCGYTRNIFYGHRAAANGKPNQRGESPPKFAHR